MDNRQRITEETPPLQVVLYQPQIPQNAGNVARTCASTHTPLHLIQPLGFHLTDRYLKRAGLDYWPHVNLEIHRNLEALKKKFACCRWLYFSARAHRPYFDFHYLPGDCLVFGSETAGLPVELLESEPDQALCIPIDRSRVRSLNMATTVAVVLFEAIRQLMLDGDKSFDWFPAPSREIFYRHEKIH